MAWWKSRHIMHGVEEQRRKKINLNFSLSVALLLTNDGWCTVETKRNEGDTEH